MLLTSAYQNPDAKLGNAEELESVAKTRHDKEYTFIAPVPEVTKTDVGDASFYDQEATAKLALKDANEACDAKERPVTREPRVIEIDNRTSGEMEAYYTGIGLRMDAVRNLVRDMGFRR